MIRPLLAFLSCIAAAAASSAPATTGPAAAPGRATGKPRRIVSLAPNLTEMLFAIGAGGEVAGVTDFCDYPPEVRHLPKVGGFINPNPEAVLALAPDLVVATPNVGNRPFVEQLMRAGTRVEIVQARNLDEIFPALEALGRATSRESQASVLVRRLKDGLLSAKERVKGLPRPRTLLCIQVEPLVVAGPGSYPHDLLTIAGGISIVPDGSGAYPKLSLEEVVRAAPDVLIQTRMDALQGLEVSSEASDSLLQWWGRWRSIPAVKAGRVHAVAGDTLLRPGPRLLEGIELLIRLLHGSTVASVRHAGQGRRLEGCR